jgi:3'-phosphoadenosine 5'-phosphosulfate sulfotransferase (PAPS reductase)/FAD synthetase
MRLEREEDGKAHIVALSGGKDSSAMALLLQEREPRNYSFVCTPTGDEFDDMVCHWQNLAKMLGAPLLPISGGPTTQDRTLHGSVGSKRASSFIRWPASR